MIYGNLLILNNSYYICTEEKFNNLDADAYLNECCFLVIPESVKQFTGKKDKKGNDVYDSDIVEFKGKRGEVWFNESAGRYYIDPKDGLELDFQFVHECEIKR